MYQLSDYLFVIGQNSINQNGIHGVGPVRWAQNTNPLCKWSISITDLDILIRIICTNRNTYLLWG